MKMKKLSLVNFRNYERLEIVFDDGVNVFIGENAQGKTNALEAIYVLAMGKSHRTSKDQDCVNNGSEYATISGRVQVHGRETALRIDLTQKGKRAFVNGVSQSKMTEYIGHFQVVLFAPEDLQLIKGSPSQRRRFIDMELGQTYPKYLFHLSSYNRVLQQRNTLLKQTRVDWDYVGVFDAQLAEHGAEVIVRRIQFVHEMNKHAKIIYRDISNGREELDIDYSASLSIPHQNSTQDYEESLSKEFKEQLTGRFKDALVQRQLADHQVGHTTVGPHRDDLNFRLNGNSVQSFASQGQQRTIALSLRLAEIDFIYHEVGDYPVLLLDDVLSELDDHRQRNLVISMSEKVQTIITTTSLAPFHGMLEGKMHLFNVHSGIMSG